jgi:hypothetical protein
MFRKTASSSQSDLFYFTFNFFRKRVAKKYNDFISCRHVHSKEGFSCSDEELFKKCEFDQLMRKTRNWSILMTFPLPWTLMIFSAVISLTTRRNMV